LCGSREPFPRASGNKLAQTANVPIDVMARKLARIVLPGLPFEPCEKGPRVAQA
jgi:hypothetical protein